MYLFMQCNRRVTQNLEFWNSRVWIFSPTDWTSDTIMRHETGFSSSDEVRIEEKFVSLFFYLWDCRVAYGKEDGVTFTGSHGQQGSSNPACTGQRWQFCLAFVHTAWRYYGEMLRVETPVQTTSPAVKNPALCLRIPEGCLGNRNTRSFFDSLFDKISSRSFWRKGER